jgi:serine/threonine protein kinase
VKNAVKVGSVIGPFRIVGELGAGGAGAVFRAQNLESGAEVALKTLKPTTALDEEIYKRFVREISVAQKLQHENVVSFDDCGVHEDILYYTMELVPWGSLSEVLARRGHWPWREVVECGIQICRGLEHLHQARIVHRDLKPANIFLSDSGLLKLGDFGLARDLEAFGLTVAGKTVGTAKYFSPEQAMAKQDIDGRTDLYALGCILFEMLAGRPPFLSQDPYSHEYVALMKKHVEELPPSVLDFAPGCPPSLAALIDNLLKKSPADRPRNAALVETMLQEILENPNTEFSQSTSKIEMNEEPQSPKSLTERLVSDSEIPERRINSKVFVAIAALAVIGIVILIATRR